MCFPFFSFCTLTWSILTVFALFECFPTFASLFFLSFFLLLSFFFTLGLSGLRPFLRRDDCNEVFVTQNFINSPLLLMAVSLSLFFSLFVLALALSLVLTLHSHSIKVPFPHVRTHARTPKEAAHSSCFFTLVSNDQLSIILFDASPLYTRSVSYLSTHFRVLCLIP